MDLSKSSHCCVNPFGIKSIEQVEVHKAAGVIFLMEQKMRLTGAVDGSGEIPEAGRKEMIRTEKLQKENFEGDEWCHH